MADPRPRGRPKSFTDKTDQNRVQSVDRAMVLLRRLSDSPGMTLSELAAATGESAATVYRVLVTLQEHDIVETEDPGQLWHVGGGAFRIGSAFLRRTKVVERARQPMDRLMRDTGETANLGIENRDEVIFLAQVETHEAIRAFFAPGTKSPMHVSGIGKALLAWYPQDRVRQIVQRQGLPGFTTLSITSEVSLERDLARTRDRGFAIDDQERAEGMRCVAAPIHDHTGGVIAALSISGPITRVSAASLDGIAAAVRDCADAISRELGAPQGKPR